MACSLNGGHDCEPSDTPLAQVGSFVVYTVFSPINVQYFYFFKGGQTCTTIGDCTSIGDVYFYCFWED